MSLFSARPTTRFASEDVQIITRSNSVNSHLDAIKKWSNSAIALESEHDHESARSDELLASGDKRGSALSAERARRIHQERCRALAHIAYNARLALNESSGYLMVDETTTHTGLDEQDRRTISEVAGWCSRW